MIGLYRAVSVDEISGMKTGVVPARPAVWREMRRFIGPLIAWLAPSVGYGLERFPLDVGAVIAANHLSAIDHPLVAVLSPRPVHFMSKAELMAIPIVGTALRWTGAFPVRRGEPDRAALRYACELAASGHVVGVHLEGTRQRLGYPGEFKGGASLIALRAGVPVIPCGLETFQWSLSNRRACALVWGEPIELVGLSRGRNGIDQATELVGGEVVRLWREAAQAVADGLPQQSRSGARRARFVPASWQPGEPFPDGGVWRH
jgi:1-acyl-sn-glycerol-3-phosphate acyltransferase